MSGEEHRTWSPTIPDNDTQIWRYRDFTQFLSILDKESLWFNRADRFADPFEGSYTKLNVSSREHRYRHTEVPPEDLDALSTAVRKFRECSYMSCWHISEHESAAMWDIYLPADKGIAIQTTVGGFRDAISQPENGTIIEDDSEEEESSDYTRLLNIGEVQYIDYDRDMIPETNLCAPLYYKRRSYQYENEFRAVFSRYSDMAELKGGSGPEKDFTTAPGRNVKISLDELIESVYVAPSAPDWFFDLVESVIEKYDTDINIQRSDMDEDPVF